MTQQCAFRFSSQGPGIKSEKINAQVRLIDFVPTISAQNEVRVSTKS